MPSQDLDQMQREITALQATVGTLIALATLSTTPSYANDAAAAAGGVTIGGITGIYRNGSIVQVRVV